MLDAKAQCFKFKKRLIFKKPPYFYTTVKAMHHYDWVFPTRKSMHSGWWVVLDFYRKKYICTCSMGPLDLIYHIKGAYFK